LIDGINKQIKLNEKLFGNVSQFKYLEANQNKSKADSEGN
jgi:hypothetical protein